ncbi:hypothetical protein CMV_026834 [Castanea mollissima]|uniref:Uncharacterized protein n=1 Tax=Castanea mollissima TaxID=60419 RepID=A0A8J4VEE1_9ROSI|nr:hypothetical protein CMV_026834 [Castanea mollissima]
MFKKFYCCDTYIWGAAASGISSAATSAVGTAAGDEVYKYAKEIINNLSCKVDSEADYDLENNYERLIEQAMKLYACRDDILAQAKPKLVTQVHEAWISRVEKSEEEVRDLETKYKKIKGKNRTWSQRLIRLSKSRTDLSQSMAEKCKKLHNLWEEGIVVEKLPERVIIMHGEEKTEDEVVSEPHGMVIDVKEVKMTNSSGQKKFEIEEIGNEASSQLRQPEGIQVEEMQLQASSTLKPQGVGGLGLTMPPKDEDWKNAKEIYLMDNELSILPENPRCPNLSALFLPRNYKLRMIPPSFFYHMPALQILNLSRTSIKSLPDSIIKLVSLKRLFLNNCHRLMMLSPKVGDLKQLEVIDLEGAKIMDLPLEIKELTNLKCLEVSFYGYISNGNGKKAMQSNAVVPCGVISALSLLEELNIDVNPDDERWDARVEDIVTEVCTLKRFTVGRHVKRIVSRVPCDAEHVTIKKLSDFGTRNMKELKCCVVGECNEVQVIIDAEDAYGEEGISEIVSESYDAERIVLGSLEYLYIYYMKSLRSIWEGSVQQNSLFLLKSLTLRTCPMLTTIFTQGLLDNLCNLEELKVEDCPSIKSIVSCGNFAELRTSHFLPNLKKILLHYMPGLVSISSGLHIAPQLEFLSLYNCPNLKNPLVDEVSSQDLKKIKGERSWWEALEWSNGRPSYLDEIFVPTDI